MRRSAVHARSPLWQAKMHCIEICFGDQIAGVIQPLYDMIVVSQAIRQLLLQTFDILCHQRAGPVRLTDIKHCLIKQKCNCNRNAAAGPRNVIRCGCIKRGCLACRPSLFCPRLPATATLGALIVKTTNGIAFKAHDEQHGAGNLCGDTIDILLSFLQYIYIYIYILLCTAIPMTRAGWQER